MTQDAEGNLTTENAQRLLAQQVRNLRAAVLTLPVILIEILLALGLFLPFVTDSIDGEDQTVNLFGLVGGLLGPDSEGEVDSASALFGTAFVVLVVVIIGSMIVVSWLARIELSTVAERVVVVFIVLLIAGTLGAWMVMSIGLSSDSPWELEIALPILTVGTLLAALFAFLPSYRRVREVRARVG
ncbi:hypothetical protein [Microbacterium murale]|uniref:Uncharacterized protein n=1 Tax=Microbacterium murale TaxID=1081040 RepID=A0ABU0P8X9_9MICO|nr:hypothetical protein [Microbacterium murale]MDQ0643799.1 hypothetical protein [Microbacterium murale]